MDHADHPEHGHAPGDPLAGQTVFPDEVWQELRAQDFAAAKYIVCLMLGIFVLGLLLYIGVAVFVEIRPVY